MESGVETAAARAAPSPDGAKPVIVLVHGAFVDGSGWAGVHRLLRAANYKVIVVQNPTTSLPEDVAATRRAIASAGREVVLVGHSCGGVIITAGFDPEVIALVYVAAFAPDRGESVSSIVAQAPAGAPTLPILPPIEGFLMLDPGAFPGVFAADVPPAVATFMADAQQPWGAAALDGKVSSPAWATKPSWYLIPRDDRVIPPDAQRGMARRARSTVREVAGSHAVYVSKPEAVAALIEEAAQVSRGKSR